MSQSSKVLIILASLLIIVGGGLWIYGNKKQTYETKLVIEASPDFLFSILIDSQQYPKWMTGVQEVLSVHEEKEILGSIDKVIIDQNGSSIGFENEVIRYMDGKTEDNKDDGPKVISIRSSNATVSNTMVFNLVELNQNRTELSYRFHVTNVGLGKWMNFFVGRVDRQALISEDIRKLKEFVEADYKRYIADEDNNSDDSAQKTEENPDADSDPGKPSESKNNSGE